MRQETAIDGFRLAYERTGAGPAALLLHGWPGDRTDYREVVPPVSAAADVIVPDLRGFGESDKHLADPAQYNAAAQARSVIGLIDELALQRPVIAGYDIGSRIAQAIARDRPDLVRALVIAPPLPGIGDRILAPQAQREFWYQAFHNTDLAARGAGGIRRGHRRSGADRPGLTAGDILEFMKFRATVELNGKTATGIEVPEDVVGALGSGKRPQVTVTIEGYTYRTTVARMGGRFLVGLNAENRTAAGVAAGDQVDVDIQLDAGPREVEVPADLAEALAHDDVARANFDGLSYTHRKEWVRWIEEAKKAETRATRLAKTVESLHAGKRVR